LLANRHLGLAEGLHGLLGTLFKTVVMVADEDSLQETAVRLQPDVAVVDLSLARNNNLRWLRALHERCPALKLVVLSAHDESSVRQASLESGAAAFVLKRSAGTDLLPTIEAVFDASTDPSRFPNSCETLDQKPA
jgi:DNA-binding NarL/FixJ family response regulator